MPNEIDKSQGPIKIASKFFILAILSSVSLRLFFTTKEPIKEDEFDYSEAFKNIIIFLLILYASGVFDKISEKISRKEKTLEYCLKNPDSSEECKKNVKTFNKVIDKMKEKTENK